MVVRGEGGDAAGAEGRLQLLPDAEGRPEGARHHWLLLLYVLIATVLFPGGC